MQKYLLWITVCLLAILTGCDEQYHHLVHSYSDAPWSVITKQSAFQNGDEDMASYHLLSEMMSGIGNVDQLIQLTIDSRESRNTPHNIYLPGSTLYEELCKKHGDRVNPPVDFYQAHQLVPKTPYSVIDFQSLEVFCSEDFDAEHPAGCSLLDILHFATMTPNRVLRNNYQVYFDTDVLCNKDGVQWFNVYKRATDVKQDDLSIINFLYLSFDKLPEPVGPRNIKVRLTADDGKVYDFETVLTFQKI